METRINISITICFALFVFGLLSVGADLFTALVGTLVLAPILLAFFAGPVLIIACILWIFEKIWIFEKKLAEPVAPVAWEEWMD